jgi:hypothetical protein
MTPVREKRAPSGLAMTTQAAKAEENYWQKPLTREFRRPSTMAHFISGAASRLAFCQRRFPFREMRGPFLLNVLL